MYKVQNNPSSKYIVDLFNKKETKYELRNADFTLPCYNTTFFGKHSMRFLGPKIWTQLDKKEKEIKTLEQFKRTKGKKDLWSLIERDKYQSHCTLCLYFFKKNFKPAIFCY